MEELPFRKKKSAPTRAHIELDAMPAKEWEACWKALWLYASWVCIRYHGTIRCTPEDLIDDALVMVLSGERQWPPVDARTGQAKDVKLVAFLCETIRGLSSNKFKRERKTINIEEEIQLRFPESSPGAHLQFISYESCPDVKAIYQELIDKVLAVICRDQIVTEIVELWVDMPDLKPKEIAVMLNLPIETVRNAQKRLRRMIRKLKKEFDEDCGPDRRYIS